MSSTPGNVVDQLQRQAAELSLAVGFADLRLKQIYGVFLLVLILFYCSFIALILVLCGMQDANFDLPDGVLYALVGSTPLIGVGLVGAVIRSLFTK